MQMFVDPDHVAFIEETGFDWKSVPMKNTG
jgi:hypothetical protein